MPTPHQTVCSIFILAQWLVLVGSCPAFAQTKEPSSGGVLLPQEPLEIGGTTQFVFDLWTVDNHWAIRSKQQSVQRVVHQAMPFSGNPVMPHDKPSYLWVVKDAEAGLLRMWYQKNIELQRKPGEKTRAFHTVIGYAESADGVKWIRPDLDLHRQFDSEPNNIVVTGPEGLEASAPAILEVPEKDRQGFKYLMLYRSKGRGGAESNGIRIIGSNDATHWDPASDQLIVHLHSDAPNTICYDPRLQQYVLYCRAKDRYRAWGDEMLDTGASRRIARMASPALRTNWMQNARPQTMLIPDEVDQAKRFNYFYGMPTVYRQGVYWGFLEPFRLNDYIYTELVVSRDGTNFQRLPGRAALIPWGPEGTWDDTMIFASPSWVEMGDQWWIYYAGWDGPHGTSERNGAIGLAKLRKEGFVSLRGPVGGGVVCTRTLRWPGGDLQVNVNAKLQAASGSEPAQPGTLKVRVSDAGRQPIEGWNYDDCEPFDGDAVRHTVRWNGRSLHALQGQTIRLEFYLQNADLFSFVATPDQD